MMGHLGGVAMQIKAEVETAIPVHCFAHCLNLCLQDTSKKCIPVRNALDLIIIFSPKQSVIFDQFKQDISVPGTGLRPLCPTRGTV